MKSSGLSIDQILTLRAQIKKDNSVAVVQLPETGELFTVKTTTEQVSGFFGQLQNGEVLIEANQPLVGVRTIKGNMLSEGKYQVIDSLRVLADNNLADTTDAVLITAVWEDKAPAAFKNGEVRIFQGSELLRTTGTDVHNFKASTGNDDDFKDIVPVVLRPSTPISINFKLAGVAPAKSAYKLELRTTEFTAIGKA
jgi:hypothetical protein